MLTVCIFLDRLSRAVISKFIATCSELHEYIIFCDYINSSAEFKVHKKNKFYDFVANSVSSHFLIMSDDGYLIRVDDEFCKGNIVPADGVGVFSAYPFLSNYSIETSFRPEHYFGCVLIGSEVKNIISDDFSFNRWMGHHALILSMVRDVTVSILPIKADVFPCLIQMKGKSISESRVSCLSVLNYIKQYHDVVAVESEWGARNDGIVEGLLNSRVIDSGIMDEHISLLTKWLSTKFPYVPFRKDITSFSLNGKSVVLFRVEHIGDVIISYPLIDSILNSGAKSIKIVTSKSTSFLFENDNRIESVIAVDDDYRDAINREDVYDLLENSLFSLERVVHGCDVAIFPQYASDITFYKHIALLLGIKCRVGIKNDVASEGGYYNLLYEHLLTDVFELQHEHAHEYEQVSSLAKMFGLSVDPSSNINILDKRIPVGNLPKKYMVISLGASCENRRWPVESYIDVISELSIKYPGLYFVIVGGEDVYESSLSIATLANCINFCARLTLQETIDVLSKSILYCGNDSGVMHLASAIGTPVIEISMHPLTGKPFHINSPQRFGPYFSRSIILQPTTPAEGHCHDFCQEKTAHCIKNIGYLRVVEAVENLLYDVQF